MPRSPQAHNWLRSTRPFDQRYTVAFVPSAFKDGFENYFRNNRIPYRVAEHSFQVKTLRDRLHRDIISDLEQEKLVFLAKHDHMRMFGGLQHVIYNQMNRRPFPHDFDEEEFLEAIFETMSKKPQHPNNYSGIRFDIGNGVVTTLPILTFEVAVKVSPVPFSLG